MRTKPKLKIGLIGLGNVGLRLAEELIKNKDLDNFISLESVLVRNLEKYNNVVSSDKKLGTDRKFLLSKLTDDPEYFFEHSDTDVVVELVGGIDEASQYVERALLGKKHVVTANKELISHKLYELTELAKSHKVKLRFEAAVGAGIPIIEVLSDMLKQNEIKRITGIINGTSNYILSAMFERSSDFLEVLKEAQNLGYAESDPTNDVDGFDAKFKINILGSIAFGCWIPLESIYVKGIRDISGRDIMYAREFKYNIKLLAITEKKENLISTRVNPALVPLSHPLANVNGNYNAVEIMGDLVGKLWIQGEGAGKNSTTSAVLGDLLGIYNSSSADIVLDKDNGQYMDDNETFSRNYVRLSVEDRYGVLSQISGIFSENKISISSVIQKDAAEMDGSVDLVVMTHEASQKNFLMAIKKINSLSVVKSNPVTIRIHE